MPPRMLGSPTPMTRAEVMAQYSAILGVPLSADPATLKDAYRAQSLRFHPDQPGGSAEMFQRVTLAYNALLAQAHAERWSTSSSAIGAHAAFAPPKALQWKGDSHTR